MKSSQKLKDKGYGKITKSLEALSKMYVDVGVQSDAGADGEGNPIINRAYFNEFGTSRIPERSFVRSAFDEQASQLDQLKARLTRGVIDGKISPAKALAILGQQHTKDVQDKIRSISTPPNAPSTIAAKGSSKPLIDTGQMVASIRYVPGSK